MKSFGIAAAAAALFGTLVAGAHHEHNAAHNALHQLKNRQAATTCGCTTSVVTYYGEVTLGVTPVSTLTTTTSSTTYKTVTISPSASPAGPFLTTLTPGTYTFPATTITLTSSTTVTAPTTTATYAPGTWAASVTTVTIVETNAIYYCPYATVTPAPAPSSAAPAPSSAAPAPSSAAPAPSSAAPASSSAAPASSKPAQKEVAPAQSSAAPAPSSAAPAPSSAAAASPSSVASSSSAPAPSSSSSSSSSSSMSANGNQWCQTYSPYTSGGLCKDAGTVSSDISGIAGRGFTCIRLYSTDCSGLTNAGTAVRANGMKMIVGVFISATGVSGAAAQVSDLTAWKQWDLVELVVIGNEAIFNGYTTASELAGFISSTKSTLSGSGYSGPCTTTETLNIWQIEANAAALTAVVDGCGANIHPFFNAATSADIAGEFVLSQIQILEGICGGGKPVWNCETGWPWQGGNNGAAVAGLAEQQKAIAGILSSAGKQCVIFDSFDAAWKEPGAYGVEQYWGTQQCEW